MKLNNRSPSALWNVVKVQSCYFFLQIPLHFGCYANLLAVYLWLLETCHKDFCNMPRHKGLNTNTSAFVKQ